MWPPKAGWGHPWMGNTRCGNANTKYGMANTECGTGKSKCGTGNSKCGNGNTKCGTGNSKYGTGNSKCGVDTPGFGEQKGPELPAWGLPLAQGRPEGFGISPPHLYPLIQSLTETPKPPRCSQCRDSPYFLREWETGEALSQRPSLDGNPRGGGLGGSGDSLGIPDKSSRNEGNPSSGVRLRAPCCPEPRIPVIMAREAQPRVGTIPSPSLDPSCGIPAGIAFGICQEPLPTLTPP